MGVHGWFIPISPRTLASTVRTASTANQRLVLSVLFLFLPNVVPKP
jgi:hypothetical protein